MENIKFNFKDKNVVITGASKGIGSAIASAFLESGATVINISNHKPIEKNEPPQYTFVKKDMTDHDSIKKWIEDFTANNKKIDYHIIPKNELNKRVEENYQEWIIGENQLNGRPRTSNLRIFRINQYPEFQTEKYRGNWDVLFS